MTTSFDETGLLNLLSTGSVDAFEIIYRKYSQSIYSNILKIIRQPEKAEEILQDVFVALWENREKINTHQSVAGWLIVVSYNKSITLLQKQVKDKLLLIGELPENVPDNMEMDGAVIEHQIGIINEAIQNLPDKRREVFSLCKLEGKTIEETAQILDISFNTVKSHLQAATKYVKSYTLGKYAAGNALSLLAIVAFLS